MFYIFSKTYILSKQFHNAIIPPRLHSMMRNEFETQCGAAMTVAIAITKNPIFEQPIKDESNERR